MLHFPKWLVSTILAICLVSVVVSVPNLFPPERVATWPNWLPKKQVNLGLDLRGGVYLLYEVAMRTVLTQRLDNAADGLRTAFRAAKPPIGYITANGLAAEGDHLTFTLREPERLDEVRTLLRKADPDSELELATAGSVVTIKFNEIALNKIHQQIVEQSIEIIRYRIDDTGTKEPTIQREGSDRIVLELPGVEDPEFVKRILGATAKMTFQLVDENANQADTAHPPPGDEALPLKDRGSAPDAKIIVQKRIAVNGDTLTGAKLSADQYGAPAVSFTFNAAGAKRFAEVTKNNVNKRFAVVIDGKVITAPVIQQPILGGDGIITGSFTSESAAELALQLRAGALPAPLVVLNERTVGPDLGADAIHSGALASLVGVSLVVIFMIVFYGLFGVFANVALLFNLCMMLAALTLLGATLTLPGIAGIALTLGMAVDANVLIYERIREEVRGGRSLISSLQAGFQRAFGTIFDSHLTTLVAGFLMFFLGSGPVKGFAVTLSIGVITSLFCAILITRLQIVTWLRRTKPKVIPI